MASTKPDDMSPEELAAWAEHLEEHGDGRGGDDE